ncbi:low-density lipoprotein receptor-related protein 4 isoform X1 [Halyomorpha halys]|uniref:low-density lipoprotein receptor-related protein 4 isoform X1 n=2 Tax=Halyomorpha halys TaxID=286706 RepID=UPI0006D50F7A|nr:low-density lipoprotein receptor-related protein 4 isoform X1 [Halyomorpha halys]
MIWLIWAIALPSTGLGDRVATDVPPPAGFQGVHHLPIREMFGSGAVHHNHQTQQLPLPQQQAPRNPVHGHGKTQLEGRSRSGGAWVVDDTNIDLQEKTQNSIMKSIETERFEEGVLGCGGWCRSGEYLCLGTCTCVPVAWRCDGDADCVKGEDEMLCTEPTLQSCPPATHIRCPHTGKCIRKDFLCDGADDCGDFSDETHCDTSLNCTENEFECNNGLCIPISWLCDGDNDCRDLSDEVNCSMKAECSPEHDFQCSDGSCISLTWRCDSEPDCSDQSDETDCPEVEIPQCGPDEVQCDYPKCVREEFRCDGDDDCGDWSDENGCPNVSGGICSDTEFRCESGKCVSKKWRCDGEPDCEGGEDEAHCESSIQQECTQEQFACLRGNCILKQWVCDGVQDCSQGEDEQNCVTPCDPATQFTCPPPNATYSRIAHCIRKKHVCDDKRDCPRGEDELNCSKPKSCSLSTKKCEQICVTTFDNKDACSCRPGFVLNDDGESCRDIDECSLKNDAVCSQICNNTIGSYICACYDGYVLRPDNITCKAVGSPPTLLFANRIDIRQVSLDHQKYTAVLKNLHNAIALDYHYKKGLIFWSDVSMDMIRRSSINGSNITDITRWGLDSPSGVAVDWIHDLLFWTDSGTRRVEVSSFDGQNRHVLVSDDLAKPRAIAVHPGEAFVFWTDWGSKPKIERIEMDGSNRRAIITESVQWPNGLCIDYPANRIYWADAKHHVIESAELDGSERRKVITKGLPHPFGVTLFEDAIYWTDWHTKSISTANKVTGTGFMTIHGQLHFPMDIHSYHSQRQPNYKNHCGNKNGGCSHLCLPNVKSFQCICPLGLKIISDNRTCDTTTDHMLLFARKKDLRLRSLEAGTPMYDTVIPVDGIKSVAALAWDSVTNTVFWTDSTSSRISSAKVNGKDQKEIVDNNLATPTGLSLDWVTKKLYWVDSGTKRVEVANLDGTMRSLLIWEDLNDPSDITVDPVNGHLFWSDWGSPAKIERAGMDGSQRTIFLTGNMSLPNGLAIDYETSRIYWTDARAKTVEYASLNGKGRTILMSEVSYPFGLTIFNSLLLWTDRVNNSIHSVDKMSGKNAKLLIRGLSGLMDLSIMEHHKETVTTKCLIKNGGCSHLCLLSPKPERYSCGCPIGIQLQEDGKNCHIAPERWLIVAHRKQIRQISLDVPYIVDVVLPIHNLSGAVAVDVDTMNGDIYWSDTSADVIRKADPVDFEVTNIVSDGLDMADGIVIDITGRKLYWTDAGTNSIQVCSLNSCDTMHKVLIWKHLDNPRAITLSYDMGLLFWTDWGSKPRIEQAEMDGHNRMTLINKDLVWPNGLAIYNNRMYWTDAKSQTIETASLTDTNDRIRLISDLPHPYALVLFGDYIYWTDWSTKAIHRAFRNGSNNLTILSDLEGLMDIRAVHKIEERANVCGTNNGGCSHLCLRNAKGYSCACPTGIILQNDNKSCVNQPSAYLLLATHRALVRVSLDTTEMWYVTLPTPNIHQASAVDYHWNKSVIVYIDGHINAIRGVNMSSLNHTWDIMTNLSQPDGLAVDWISNTIYWSDKGTKMIEVSKLDGSFRKVIIPNAEEPKCIAIHPKMGYLYWADWGRSPKIEWSYLDGSGKKVIIEGDLGFPYGLAVDTEREKLYWTDSLKNRIEMSELSGSGRILLVPDAGHPYGLTVYEDYIFWTDWYKKGIEQADAESGREKTKLPGHVEGVMDIKGVSSNKQLGRNPCSVHNGYCTHLCLFRGSHGYVCACPDIKDPRCSTKPSLRVEWEVEFDPLGSGFVTKEVKPENSSTTLIILGVVISVIIICVVGCIVYNQYRRKKRSERVYMYNGRSVLTFSNPNYNVSSSNIEATEEHHRPSIWRKLRFDRSHERTLCSCDTGQCDGDKAGNAEVVSLIRVPPSPSPTLLPSKSLASTSNC